MNAQPDDMDLEDAHWDHQIAMLTSAKSALDDALERAMAPSVSMAHLAALGDALLEPMVIEIADVEVDDD